MKPPVVYFSTRHPGPAKHGKDTRKSCFDVSRVNPRGLMDQDRETVLASTRPVSTVPTAMANRTRSSLRNKSVVVL